MKGMLGKLSKRRSSSDGAPQSSGGSAAGRPGIVEQQLASLKAAEEARKAREERLAKLAPFCIDATLVECLATGHESLEDKLNAFKLLASCGLKNIVLAAFVKDKSPDLKFLQAMRAQNLIDEHCLASSELYDANGSDLPGQDLPFGLARMIQFGIQNAILECDLAAPYINWNNYSTADFCSLLESRCRWVAANLMAGRTTPPASFVHLRDFATAMQVAPRRVLEVVEFLGRLPPGVRPRGVLVHEPAGGHLPLEAGPCVAAVRAVMDATGWTEQQEEGEGEGEEGTGSGGGSGGGGSARGDGLVLVHVGAGFGLAHATVLECLAAGGGGVVASLCEEAEPASSHASSLLDLVDLSRLGNPHVGRRFSLGRLRAAAREVTAMARRAEAEAEAERARREQQQQQAAEEDEAGLGWGEAQQRQQAQHRPPPRQPLILGHA